ncbi:hypothetical protein L596_007628 [Steinernema carpocapsae]|uniref:EGF-like domain-containing protein n=1 Tax=Steinernema carpocapsae TaxID=34508 RepID=A0A4U5P9Z6_STECR|nr:hypothetical protein L596_007628 [Steinernema carpocapsae]
MPLRSWDKWQKLRNKLGLEVNLFSVHVFSDQNECLLENSKNSPCNSTDIRAECTDLVNEFKCTCSRAFTGRICDIPVAVFEALKVLGANSSEFDPLLRNLLKQPATVKDLAPFVLGLTSKERRAQISWEHEDIFIRGTFERRELDLVEEMVKWNSPTLGNCFTFNHESRRRKHVLRFPGRVGGFEALVKIRQDEYLDWVDTASLLVFIHSAEDPITGESIRFHVFPESETDLLISPVVFERIGGEFGKCVQDKSEVKSYYYPGNYSIDGCLRSCYQDKVLHACGCMDPRYPMSTGVEICKLADRHCVLNVVMKHGDASPNSSICECPSPCFTRQFNVHINQPFLNSLRGGIQGSVTGSLATINVFFSDLTQTYFKEQPKMDINKFISMLGGLLGALMGVTFITVVEFVYLLMELIYAGIAC